MEELGEFDRYMAHLSEGLGHADRHAGLGGYCTGLMAPLKQTVRNLRVRSQYCSFSKKQ